MKIGKRIPPSSDIWSKQSVPRQGCDCKANILCQNGGLTRYVVQRIHSPLGAWENIVTDEMLYTTVNATNREGHIIQGNSFVETAM